MPDPVYTAEATVTGGRRGRATTRDGGLDLVLRVPKELGGPGGAGTDPEELFAAGYGACFQSSLNLVARRRRIPLGESTVRARVHVHRTADQLWTLAVELTVWLPGLDQALAAQLVTAAHGLCPYTRATRGNLDLTTEVITG